MSLPKIVHSQKFTVHSLEKTVNCQLSSIRRAQDDPEYTEGSTVNCSHGFSLIELLIVVSIIGIIISFGSASWTNAQQKSRDGQRKSDLKAVQQALETFYQQYGRYPYMNSGRMVCAPAEPELAWGSAFTCGSSPAITFMQKLPSDPIYQSDTARQYFYYPSTLYNYTIFATLENTNDPDMANDPCSTYPFGSRNYCVTSP